MVGRACNGSGVVIVPVGCTDSLYLVIDHLFTLMDANKGNFVPVVQDVFYGDQKRIPRTPSITVAGSQKTRELAGAPRRTLNTFNVFINVFFCDVRDTEVNHRASDRLAEDVETLIHADITLGGLVINSLVALNEPGFLNRDTSKFRGSRLVIQATSKTSLPMSPSYNQ